MVARLITGKNMRGLIHYNEHKVMADNATCLQANQFGSDPVELSPLQKFHRFQKNLQRNKKVKTNTVHVSLNFSPRENLSPHKLSAIATSYMDKIGFGNQPYLVYQHKDAAHPHVHIITTNIQADGKRIDLHNIGRNQSESARKEIEIEFNLLKAAQPASSQNLQAVPLEKIIYGRSETKSSIARIVSTITRTYKYTSLPELNAILRQYNVHADRGKEETRIFEKKGLRYTIIDRNGNHVGVPIKASALPGKPTLRWLEKQFLLNDRLRKPLRDQVQNLLTDSLNNQPKNWEALTKLLQQQNVDLVLRKNSDGRIYGITLVDHKNKVVFNGSALGKSYSAQAISDQFGKAKSTFPKSKALQLQEVEQLPDLGIEKIIDVVTSADEVGPINYPLKKRKKKKRRRTR
jgi:hypothetical protein